MARLVGAIPDPATPDDYERLLAPIYAWNQASAQRRRRRGRGGRQPLGGRRWHALGRHGARARRAARCALRAGVPARAWQPSTAPVWARCSADRRAGRCAAPGSARSARRRGGWDRAGALVFGHTHRTGRARRATTPPSGARPAARSCTTAAAGSSRRMFMGARPARREPVLARRRDRDRRRRAAAAGAPARRRAGVGPARGRPLVTPGAPQPTTPAVNCTAWQITPSPSSSSSTPVVWRACSTSRWQPACSTASLPAVDAHARPASPAAVRSSTAHTAPASYGPDHAPGCSGVGRPTSASGASSGRSAANGSGGSIAEQLADLVLRLVVRALAVVHREQPQAPVEEVARRPRLVAVLLPQREVRVEQDGMLDAQPRDRGADLLGVLRRRIAAGMDGDHAQAGRGVARVPGLHVAQRAQRVGAAEVPELDEHGAPELLVEAQASRR